VQTIFWGITNRCPLHCSHCYDWDNISTNDKLSLNQLMDVLDVLRSQGIRHVQFSGGEPMARFNDLLRIVRIASADMECWLLTSAYGFTASAANELKSAGLLGVNISLDQWQEEKHNDFRHNGSQFLNGYASHRTQQAGRPSCQPVALSVEGNGNMGKPDGICTAGKGPWRAFY
jgi:MoaA/NifB/PqqE/SkfB family radical SAM enzyme